MYTHLGIHIPPFAVPSQGGIAYNQKMIKPKCDMCKKELEEYGALLFSPPEGERVIKKHLCRKCYDKIKEQYNL